MLTKSDIERYFNAEKKESLVFVIVGAAAIAAALFSFFFMATGFYKGAALPLILIGTVLTIVGYTVYKRSDEDRKRNVYAYDMNPSAFEEKEWPRMRTVMKNFAIYRYTELCLLLAGITLYFCFNRNESYLFWKGLGLGLAVMALLTLVADYFAEKRGRTYKRGIEEFIRKKS